MTAKSSALRDWQARLLLTLVMSLILLVSEEGSLLSIPAFSDHGVETDPVKCLETVLMSEASEGTRTERIAVAWTVFNRVNSPSFPDSICEVVYSGFPDAPQYSTRQHPTGDEPAEISIRELAPQLIKNPGTDPTDWGTHFFSPRSMPKEGDPTDGYDVKGGPHVVPGIDRKVYFPSWTTTMEWIGNLPDVRQAYYMFYRPAGDINKDNRLDILDYNLLLDCYSDLSEAKNCNEEEKQSADLNDDGDVNGVDYNIMLRSFETRGGE